MGLGLIDGTCKTFHCVTEYPSDHRTSDDGYT